ncbi:MAG: XRE family transcriptional regulator [Sciscionella sp.]
MEDQETVQRNIQRQRQWYGEPLGDRVRRLIVAFDVSQANLAEVLRISAPMLSQVMSGRRAKIGNPAVLARLIMLERTVLTPEVASGRPEALQHALKEVQDSSPSVTIGSLPVGNGADERAMIGFLRRLAEPTELADAAEVLDDKFPDLASLLRHASEHV